MAPKIAIVFYSMYGHIFQLAKAEQEGIKAAGGEATLIAVPETLDSQALGAMHAPDLKLKDHGVIVPEATEGKDAFAVLADLLDGYDGYLFGIPTRFGNFPAQWKTFWDRTGQKWFQGSYIGKYAGVFVSSSGPGGGQESTAIAALSTLAHHGIIFVPLGYGEAMPILTDLSEPSTSVRNPSEKELSLAKLQGRKFHQTLTKVTF
ncbi:MAG: hypothetical protein M1838_004247 [Thelocarpon superellum]|nr:MAG: hypothetical protein M1838_004247 [Thelocarpon superellum]